MCQPSACSNYQVCGQISSKTFNLQGWNLQHCPQSAQSLGKNIKNNIYSINIYGFFNIISFAQASIILTSNFIKKIKFLVIKNLKKVLEFFWILIMVGKRAL